MGSFDFATTDHHGMTRHLVSQDWRDHNEIHFLLSQCKHVYSCVYGPMENIQRITEITACLVQRCILTHLSMAIKET